MSGHTFRPANIWYVSKDGITSSPTGGPLDPFPTISAALTQINALPTSAGSQTIVIYPGTYVENLDITRGYVNITSFAPSQNSNSVTTLVGSVTVNITAGGNLFANQVQFSGFTIAQPSSTTETQPALRDISTVPHSLLVSRMAISGKNRLINHNSTASDGRFFLEDCELYQTTAAVTTALTAIRHACGAAVFARNNVTALKNVALLEVAGSGVLWSCTLCNFQSTTTDIAAQPIIRLASPVAFPVAFGLCTFAYTQAASSTRPPESSAIQYEGATSQVLLLSNCYFLLTGTDVNGYAIAATLGSADPQVYTSNCFAFPGTAYFINTPAYKLAPAVTRS